MSAYPIPPTHQRSFAHLGGYSGIAQRLGTQLCGCGPDRWGPSFNHEDGETAYRMTVIHWRDRTVTRRGLYRFLKLVAMTRIPHHQMDKGRFIYEQNVVVNALARQLGVRFPHEFADKDRARVRLWLGQVQDLDHVARRKITTWSR